MAEKLSDKLKGLFKRADTSLGKGVDRLKSYPAKIKSLPKKGYDKVKIMQNVLAKSIVGKGAITKKPKLSTSKALTVFDPKKALPATASKFAKATKTAGKFGKLKAAARVASRVALPLTLGVEGASLAYKVATLSPEKKAKVKKLKSKLSKQSTKDYHADLMKMSTGGDTMLKNPKKADLDKDGKLSGYEKKRAKAIESNMKQKPIKAVLGIAAMGLLGAKALKDKKNKTTGPILMPQDRKNQTTGLKPEDKKNQQQPQTTGQQQASKGKMMKAYKGDMAKGYGAARTQGQGLQDENLIPGKSLDYYKDIM